jgi:hypothetical protein
VAVNSTVKGAGPSATTVIADRSWASAFGAYKRSNVVVRDLTLTAKAGEQDGVKFGVCKNPVVRNVVVHDMYIGIALYSCTDGIVKDCKVYDCWANGGTGIWIGQGETWPELSVGGLIEDCEAWGGSYTSFRVAGHVTSDYYSKTRASGVTLRNCDSHITGNHNFLFTYSADLTLDNCTSDTVGYSGLHLSGISGATVNSVSTSPFVSTAANDPNMFATFGASSSIVVQ